MSKFILNETQADRDKELSEILGLPLGQIMSIQMATPDSIRIWTEKAGKPIKKSDYVGLYSEYKYLNLPAYLKTLMMTSVQRRDKELMNILKTIEHKRCLDFGSGVGTHAIAMTQRGNDVTMMDVSGPLLEFALKRFHHRGLNVGYVFNDIDLPEEEYDFVCCSDVLEHVCSPLVELKRITASLKPGGLAHLLVSPIVKPSSGHFLEPIQEWRQKCLPYLEKNYKRAGHTLWLKRQ